MIRQHGGRCRHAAMTSWESAGRTCVMQSSEKRKLWGQRIRSIGRRGWGLFLGRETMRLRHKAFSKQLRGWRWIFHFSITPFSICEFPLNSEYLNKSAIAISQDFLVFFYNLFIFMPRIFTQYRFSIKCTLRPVYLLPIFI